jgi:hypothetical protein
MPAPWAIFYWYRRKSPHQKRHMRIYLNMAIGWHVRATVFFDSCYFWHDCASLSDKSPISTTHMMGIISVQHKRIAKIVKQIIAISFFFILRLQCFTGGGFGKEYLQRQIKYIIFTFFHPFPVAGTR